MSRLVSIAIAVCFVATHAAYGSPMLGQNLVINGSFESFDELEGSDGPPPVITETGLLADLVGWEESGTLSLDLYTGDFWEPSPNYENDVPPNAGEWVLFGGDAGTSITQTISMDFASDLIDEGQARFDLSGWLGSFNRPSPDGLRGCCGEADQTMVTIEFLDSEGLIVGDAMLVGPTEPQAGLVNDEGFTFVGFRNFSEFRDIAGDVPLGSRSARITASFVLAAGDNPSNYNNANLDLVAFSIVPSTGTLGPLSMVLAVATLRRRRDRRLLNK